MMDANPAPPAERRFGVMSTFAELFLRADEDIACPFLDAAEADLHALSARLTRFDPTSELEQLNDRHVHVVSEPLADILRLGQRAWFDTGGRFDIAIGAELIAAGYDRDFDELELSEQEQLQIPARLRARSTQSTRAVVRPVERLLPAPPFEFQGDGGVRLRDGVRLDLGGIAKGWACDHICARLASVGSCLVNLGGDISLHVAEGDPPWSIGVEVGDQLNAYDIARGGLATSGVDRRVWRAPSATGELAHHIIDPRTGAPALSDVMRLTVFADDCVEAEVWAKALLMVGFDAAGDEAQARGLTAIVTRLDGATRLTGALA